MTHSLHDYVEIIIFLVVTLLFLGFVSYIFGVHFLQGIRVGARVEFRTRAGVISFLGFLAFIFLFLHTEARGYLTLFFSTESEKMSVLQAAEHSQNTMVEIALFAFIANLVLLGILTIRHQRNT